MTATLPPADPILTLEAVVAGYGKTTILNGTTFSVPRGSITTVREPCSSNCSRTPLTSTHGCSARASGRVRAWACSR